MQVIGNAKEGHPEYPQMFNIQMQLNAESKYSSIRGNDGDSSTLAVMIILCKYDSNAMTGDVLRSRLKASVTGFRLGSEVVEAAKVAEREEFYARGIRQ